MSALINWLWVFLMDTLREELFYVIAPGLLMAIFVMIRWAVRHQIASLAPPQPEPPPLADTGEILVVSMITVHTPERLSREELAFRLADYTPLPYRPLARVNMKGKK